MPEFYLNELFDMPKTLFFIYKKSNEFYMGFLENFSFSLVAFKSLGLKSRLEKSFFVFSLEFCEIYLLPN